MKKPICINTLFFAFLLLCLFSAPAVSKSHEFGVLVVPSLTDSKLDGWYRIPPNSGPSIPKTSSIYRGQMFNLLVIFRGYASDKDNNLHVRYDVQIYDPNGNPTGDTGSDLLAYEGPMGSPEALVLSRQFLKIVFTDKYPLGTYKIKVTAHDKISGNTVTTEIPIELIPFALPDEFKSQQEAGEWIMSYHKSPTPVRAISGVRIFINPDTDWINNHLNMLTFFRRIFSDNPFLFENIANHFGSLPADDQRKLLLISAISNDSVLRTFVNGEGKEEFRKFYESAKNIEFPNIDGEINSPMQLDILWSEFLTTGRYEPVRKIVSALELQKYEGALKIIKEGKVEVTKEMERNAYLEATYRSATWSLISNCKQMPLVLKYCVYMYEKEPLDEDIKNQLGSILNIVQKELQEEQKATPKQSE
jgi:hypothetical protein